MASERRRGVLTGLALFLALLPAVTGRASAAPAPLSVVAGQAQASGVVLDRIVARVNGELIHALDVREVRLLRLLPGVTEATDDESALDGLIDRRLELADVTRSPPPEPTAADIAGRRHDWESGWPSGTDVASLERNAGVSDDALNTWFRDTLVIEAYVRQRFSGAPPTHEDIVTYVRDHAPEFARPDGRPVDVNDPAVQAMVRERILADRRAAGQKSWLEALRARAEIIR